MAAQMPIEKSTSRDDFFAALDEFVVPEEFLSVEERDQGVQDRDPFEGWGDDRMDRVVPGEDSPLS